VLLRGKKGLCYRKLYGATAPIANWRLGDGGVSGGRARIDWLDEGMALVL